MDTAKRVLRELENLDYTCENDKLAHTLFTYMMTTKLHRRTVDEFHKEYSKATTIQKLCEFFERKLTMVTTTEVAVNASDKPKLK